MRRPNPRIVVGVATLATLLVVGIVAYDSRPDGISTTASISRDHRRNTDDDSAKQSPTSMVTWETKRKAAAIVKVADSEDNDSAPSEQEELDMDVCKSVASKRPTLRDATNRPPFKGLAEDEVVALPSFPRSGNSLTRLLLERVTRIYTGSVFHDTDLLKEGWLGEGERTAEKVIFVKSHEPMLSMRIKEKFTKVLYVVRNPLESICSFFNFKRTSAHTESVNFTRIMESEGMRGQWERHVMSSTIGWNNHAAHWLERARDQTESVLFIRYEDIVGENGQRVLESILDFVFEDGKSDPQVRAMYDRIPCAIYTSIGKTQVGGYKPRHSDGQDPLVMYTPEMIDEVLSKSIDNLCALGYDDWLRPFGHSCK